ncbi:hypothetical protein DL764_001518 [Monosporascus ibericus]|uniref:Uncharacterized protein n=1 Tax=Monosporascus ibericus TaxID=155417 RepID=A0A4Q4TQU5_9PEZI|nr:hypothetical protein DL764_001518 [Monosporascus ibericus]
MGLNICRKSLLSVSRVRFELDCRLDQDLFRIRRVHGALVSMQGKDCNQVFSRAAEFPSSAYGVRSSGWISLTMVTRRPTGKNASIKQAATPTFITASAATTAHIDSDLDSGLQQDPVPRECRRQQQHREEARDIRHEEGPGLGAARGQERDHQQRHPQVPALCLAYGNAYRSTPTSPAIAMYTMFRESITAGIGYDVTSNKEQSTMATAIIAVRCGVKPTILRNAMKAISSEMITTPTHGMPYIRHL